MRNDRLFLGISHTPLLGLNPIVKEVENELHSAIDKARKQVLAFNPELVVLMAPDHYNGFFNELMPPFCIASKADAVGDYLTPSGSLNVDSTTALSIAEHLMDQDFDIAISRSMKVDHGFSQPLQLIWGDLSTPPVIPIFLNAVAAPVIPRLRRCRALGQAVGTYLKDDNRRILFIGSGGLSHEPPVPTLDDPDAAVRERITARQNPTQVERDAKTKRVMAAGMALASGSGAIKPLNPSWDKQWMDAMSGDQKSLDQLCSLSESSISQDGGRSAHESKSWLVARAALVNEGNPICTFRHYQAIPEYIAGFGIQILK
jgi:2,3-dihydroxyphenylpropionate 1,2-dioxygenase